MSDFERIRPEIAALVKRGNITSVETKEIRIHCNSYEWEAVVHALDDETFAEEMQYALANCHDCFRPTTTAIEGLYAPELLKRFRSASKAARDYGDAVDGVRQALGHKATHYFVVAGDVKDLVEAITIDRAASDRDNEAWRTLNKIRYQNEDLGQTGNAVRVIGWGPAHLTQREPKASIGIREPFVAVEFDDGGVFSVSRELVRLS